MAKKTFYARLTKWNRVTYENFNRNVAIDATSEEVAKRKIERILDSEGFEYTGNYSFDSFISRDEFKKNGLKPYKSSVDSISNRGAGSTSTSNT